LRPPRPSSAFPGPSGLRSLKPPGDSSECAARLLLSCTSTPPQRLAPPLTASLSASPADPEPPSKSASQKLLDPSASPEPATLLSTTPAEAASDRLGVTRRKSRPQGLATLSAALAREPLGGLFQPPTLLGFALQSLVSSRAIGATFPPSSPLLRFPTKPLGLVSALQRFDPASGSRPPQVLPEGLVRVGGMCSPELSDLSGSPAVDPHRKASPLPIPLSALLSGCLTTTGLVSLKVSLSTAWLSPSEEGAGPYGLSHRLPSPAS
jgi:hypothetical protein